LHVVCQDRAKLAPYEKDAGNKGYIRYINLYELSETSEIHRDFENT